MGIDRDRVLSIMRRVGAKTGNTIMSDEQIIIALQDEIDYYRAKIGRLLGDEMNDHHARMIVEYYQVKGRYDRLHKMVVKYEAGTLDFEPDCPIDLLKRQKRAMGEYLNALEIRAEIEGVEL